MDISLTQPLSVIITTSGIGSRLNEYTKYTNKALVSINSKLTISHIIDTYPPNTRFVITLGYYGNFVRDYLSIAYPTHIFIYVDIDNYNGYDSSLGYSLLQAKEHLQSPFIFHSCDTVTVTEDSEVTESGTAMTSVLYNWCAGYTVCDNDKDISQYRSYNTETDRTITTIHEKNASDYDHLYIGLCGIYDYDVFWTTLGTLHESGEYKSRLSDCHVILQMIDSGHIFLHIDSPWLDIGNMASLEHARKTVTNEFNILNKFKESISFVDGHVIKFFHDLPTSNNRVQRAEQYLTDIVPNIVEHRGNFYKYAFTDGTVLSKVVDAGTMPALLNWASIYLWKLQSTPADFHETCFKFYFTKTRSRLDMLFENTDIKDKVDVINGVVVKSVYELINDVDVDMMCDVQSYTMHGDFIFDNILACQNRGQGVLEDGSEHSQFKLLDWRQDFGGDLQHGDIYYDLSKLYHNLIINHENIHDGLFTANCNGGDIIVDVKCNYHLIEQIEILKQFVEIKGLDFHKVKLLAAIIWLNMAPLHEPPLNTFLYYFGKYQLSKLLG